MDQSVEVTLFELGISIPTNKGRKFSPQKFRLLWNSLCYSGKFTNLPPLKIRPPRVGRFVRRAEVSLASDILAWFAPIPQPKIERPGPAPSVH
jgi:hypothetical protein